MFLMKHIYDHQTFQNDDLLRGALTNKYAWHLDRVIFLGQNTYVYLQKMCGHQTRQGADLA